MSKKRKAVLIVLLLFWLAWLTAGIIALTFFVTRSKAEGQDTYINPQYVKYCEEIGKRYHISPWFLVAFIEAESSGQPRATNGKCYGLCQIYVDVHRDRMKKLGVTDIYDPYSNILMSADILVELFERYDSAAWVCMAYNGSSDAMRRDESFNFTDYANKVLNRSYELETIHGLHDIPIKEKKHKKRAK